MRFFDVAIKHFQKKRIRLIRNLELVPLIVLLVQ